MRLERELAESRRREEEARRQHLEEIRRIREEERARREAAVLERASDLHADTFIENLINRGYRTPEEKGPSGRAIYLELADELEISAHEAFTMAVYLMGGVM